MSGDSLPRPSRGQPRRRLLALAFGALLLLAAEAGLRLAGYAGPGDRHDPLAGFAGAEPLFVRARDGQGQPVWTLRPDRRGAFNPVSFPAVKDPQAVRLFCLGGSSTFGFPLDASASFCAALGRDLSQAHPDRRFEVINCGGMSYGSRRVLHVLREVAGLQADALVVYMGHNEYVERRFFAPFLEEPAWRRRLRAGLARIRLYVALRRTLARLTPASGGRGAQDDFFGVGPLRDDSRRLPRSAAEDRLVAGQFRFALDEMAAAAARAGVPLLLVRPASNLRDWSPEASEWSEALPERERLQRDRAYAAAQAAWQRGDAASTLTAADAVLRIDPLPAQAHFLRGRALLATGHRDEALASLEAARDRDAVPIRMPGFLGEAIGEAWGRLGLVPLDGEAELARASADGIVGDAMILDYCHPTPAGHRRIAALLWRPLHEALWPGGEVPAQPAAPPLADDNAALYTSAFGAAWSGQMLLRQGRPGPAIPLFQRAIALDAQLATAHEGLGRALGTTGRLQEAAAALETAGRLAPTSANVWNNLGLVYLALGRAGAAEEAFRRALEGGAGEGVVRRNLAGALLQLERLDEARRETERALELSPADAASWLRLGEVAAAQGDLAAARRAFEQALALDPGLGPAREGLSRLP